MATVYLETSFVSACVTDRTDVASRYRKQISLEWWNSQRRFHRLMISPEVTNELDHPKFRQRYEALAMISDLDVLKIDEEVIGIAKILVDEKVMPGPVAGDAMHVAVACSYGMDYLLT